MNGKFVLIPAVKVRLKFRLWVRLHWQMSTFTKTWKRELDELSNRTNKWLCLKTCYRIILKLHCRIWTNTTIKLMTITHTEESTVTSA